MTTQIVIMTDAEVERYADGKDEGLGALLTEKGPLPLKAVDVQAHLEAFTAQVTLTQIFVNNHAEPVEATYIFPLPDRAAVTGFRLEVAGRVVDGVLREREAARQEYDEALEAGNQAAITEEERPGVFTIRVGNLPPRESATVRLTMVGPLIYDAGEVTFRFPLVVAPRYIPGTPLDGESVGSGTESDTYAVPDASRITPPVLMPGYPNPVRLSIAVDVQPAGLPFSQIKSSLHAVSSEQSPDGAMHIVVQAGERLDRDFILRYQIAEGSIKSALTLVPDDSKSEGTFMLTLVPPVPKEERSPRPRNVVFVLDRSGSMDGWKIVAARRALGRMIDSLTNSDKFTVFAFDDSVEIPVLCGDTLAAATDRNRFRVIEWLARIGPRGGTDMFEPLDRAARRLAEQSNEGADSVLVLLTDGQVGNEDQILQALGSRLIGIRIFTLGIDQAVNEAFLRRLAALGGGSCDVVESPDRLDEVMAKVQRRIGKPMLTGLRLEPCDLEIDANSQVPARLPDMFPSAPLTIMGRYRGAPKGKIILRGMDDAGRTVECTVESHASCNPVLAQIWARGRLRDLEDQWVSGTSEAPADLQKQIVELSLKFGVLCRFTAFVVVDRTEKVNVGGKQDRLTQPVELPCGWTTPSVGSAAAGMLGQVLRSKSLSCNYLPSTDPDDFDMDQSDGMEGTAASEMQDGLPFGEPVDGDELCFEEEATLEEPLPGILCEAPQMLCEALDLTAYCDRAREMLENLRADGDNAHALGVLAVSLQALLDDLRSIGADETVFESLAQLLEELSREHSKDNRQLLALAERVLVRFAESAAATA